MPGCLFRLLTIAYTVHSAKRRLSRSGAVACCLMGQKSLHFVEPTERSRQCVLSRRLRQERNAVTRGIDCHSHSIHSLSKPRRSTCVDCIQWRQFRNVAGHASDAYHVGEVLRCSDNRNDRHVRIARKKAKSVHHIQRFDSARADHHDNMTALMLLDCGNCDRPDRRKASASGDEN